MSMPSLEPQTLSLKYAAIGLIGVSCVVGLFMLGAVMLTKQREQQIIESYTKETQDFITANKVSLKKLFIETFNQCQLQFVEEEKGKSPQTYLSSIECPQARQVFTTISLEHVRNSSAIAYVWIKDERVAVLEASMKYNPLTRIEDAYQFSYGRYNEGVSNRIKLRDYFLHNAPISLWDDYIGYIPGKEVIVPVEIDGQRAGYIFRGVIEK